jgi:hypothetical protein
MSRLITGTHPTISPWGKVFCLYDDGSIFMFTDLTASAGKGRSLPAWETTGYYGYWLAPSVNELLAINAEAEVGCDLMLSPARGVSWVAKNSQAGVTGSRLAFDLSNRLVGWAVDMPWGSITTAMIQQMIDSGMPAEGYYTYADARDDLSEYHCDFLPLHVSLSSDGGRAWSTVLLGYVGQLVPVRLMVKAYLDGVDYFMGHEFYTSPTHTWDDWNTAMPLMTMAYALANGFGGGYTYDGLDAPDLAFVDRWDLLPGPYEHWGYWVQNNACLEVAPLLQAFEPSISDTMLASFGDASACYVVSVIQYAPNEAMMLMNGSYCVPIALAPVAIYPGYMSHLQYSEIEVHVIHKVLAVGTHTNIAVTLPPGERALRVSADPTSTDDLYIMTDVCTLYCVTWPGTTPVAVTYPMDPADGYAANVLVTSAGTLLVSWMGWDDGISDFTLEIYRSTDGSANWTTIDLFAELPYSWWSDTFQMSELSDGTIVMVLSSGKCLCSGDDGASWQATAVLAPAGETILSVEAV